jgi:hypothetical protein
MIDEILELVLDVVIEVIPNSVWRVLAFVLGVVVMAAGLITFNQSSLTGGVLIAVGMFLLGGSVISSFL